MRRILRTALVAILLAVCTPLFAAAAQAAPANAPSATQAHGVQGYGTQALLPGSPEAATPSPSGPVNPGTGETGQAEGTRLDWAPLVIGAIVLITLAAVLIWRRRRGNTTVV